ncbi:hypothetical protein DFA_06428 [Cavenderia fasciculata]|uniref:F-box domain-containing protein n=1 Tax=Cavenderia fasciculata TaxID=261658 RepID=F4PIZ2_CACFS|nr:uncharacterized protein DFA_06428 [Cavenderia fasciculata]EGG24278.1 hypothetical protein DFA_06428 [Cavenderia fasciculata]|eukprot:XP_004362129.1 hypothetical protein DFA_06428 [Cavenderia fasciculata]
MRVKGKRKAKVSLESLEKEEEYRELMCTEWKAGEQAIVGAVLPWYAQTIILDHLCAGDEKISILVAMVCWRYRRYVAQTYFQKYYNPYLAVSISDVAHHIFSRYSLYRDVKSLHLGYARNRNLFYGVLPDDDNGCDDEDWCGGSDLDKSIPVNVFKERFGQKIESFSLQTGHSYGHDGDGEDHQYSVDDSFRGEEYVSLLSESGRKKDTHLTQSIAQLFSSTSSTSSKLKSTLGIQQLTTLVIHFRQSDNQILYPSLSNYLMTTTTLTDLSLSSVDHHFPTLLLGALTRPQSPLKRLDLQPGESCVHPEPIYFASLDYLSIKEREFRLCLDPKSDIKRLRIEFPDSITNLSQYVTQNKHLIRLTTGRGLDNLVSNEGGMSSPSIASLTVHGINFRDNQKIEKQLLDLLSRFPSLTTLCIRGFGKCLEILKDNNFTMTKKPNKETRYYVPVYLFKRNK